MFVWISGFLFVAGHLISWLHVAVFHGAGGRKQFYNIEVCLLVLVGKLFFCLVMMFIDKQIRKHPSDTLIKTEYGYHSISGNLEEQQAKIHEFKNQIMCMEALLVRKNYQELEEYVRKISGSLRKDLDSIHTNHVIVDAVLNRKYQETLEKNIVFIFQMNDLSKINIRDEDIVIILSNLLNNAVEACEKCRDKKMIKVKFVQEENYVILSVRNTCEEKILIKHGSIQTSKKQETEKHGIGIKNIVAVIKKYSGCYAIRYNEREFYFSVMIPQ